MRSLPADPHAVSDEGDGGKDDASAADLERGRGEAGEEADSLGIFVSYASCRMRVVCGGSETVLRAWRSHPSRSSPPYLPRLSRASSRPVPCSFFFFYPPPLNFFPRRSARVEGETRKKKVEEGANDSWLLNAGGAINNIKWFSCSPPLTPKETPLTLPSAFAMLMLC